AVDRATRANLELRQANARERQARAEAQRRFALARKAVESYYTGASEDVLLKQPQLASLRNKLLNMSLAFYKELQGELQREGRDARTGRRGRSWGRRTRGWARSPSRSARGPRRWRRWSAPVPSARR